MTIFARDRFRKIAPKSVKRLFQQSFTYLVCCLIALQPLTVELVNAQEIIIDPSGNVGFKPSLQKSSRPQVVNIARPNSGGVSHNKYQRFDTSSRGVVLNNSKTATTTHVAGGVSGNPNLTGSTASTIVNEVTSSRASALNGAIEVAGDRAGVVIANPNGVTCNGCSFINTSVGTLTTGVPVIDGGNVRLNVQKGTVKIGRKGLKGQAGDRGAVGTINLIGRSVVIDGRVTAVDEINVQGGAQSWDLINRRRVSTLNGTGTAPTYSIDGTAFGAMEAGRIQIIGNERGLGVRALGALRSTTKDTRVINDGNVTVRSITAQGQARVQASQGDLTIERDISSLTSNVVAYGRQDVVTNDLTGIYGATGVQITARKGTLTFAGDLQSDGNVDLFGERKLSFSGYGSTTGEFKLRGRTEIAVESGTIVAATIDADDGVTLFRLSDAALFSGTDLRVKTANFELGRNVVVDGLSDSANSNLIVDATGHFRNSSDLRNHTDATITYGGNLYNLGAGVISEATLRFSNTKELHNDGVLFGENLIDIDVAKLFNNETGSILSKKVVIDTTDVFENKGSIVSDGDLLLTAGTSLTNNGFMKGIRTYLTANAINIGGKGELRARDYAQFNAAEAVHNEGVLAALGAFKVTAASLTNDGAITTDTTFDATADAIINNQAITAGEKITLRSTGQITNTGTLASYGHLYLLAGPKVENQGNILVDGVADIRGTWFENKGNDAVLRAKTGRIYSPNVRNSGRILFVDDVRYRDLNLFDNSGVFASQGSIELKGKTTAARGYFRSGGSVVAGLKVGDTQSLTAGKYASVSFNTLIVDGQIAAGGDVKVSGPTSLAVTGDLQAGRHLYLTAPTISVGSDSTLTAAENGYVTSTASFTNDGVISLEGVLQLGRDSGAFENTNLIAAAALSKFYLYQGSFTNSGVIRTTSAASIVAANVVNSGQIWADGGLSLNAQKYRSETYLDSRNRERVRWVATDKGDINSGGILASNGHVRLVGRHVTVGADAYVSGDLFHVTADRFYNRGLVAASGEGRNDWRIAETLYQYGTTYADGDIRAYAGALSTYDGSHLGSGKNLSLYVTNNAALRGGLSANAVTLNAASISSTDTASIVSTNDLRLTTTAKMNYYGELAAGDDLVLSAEQFDLRGNAFGKRVSITGKSRGYNRGSIYASETANINLTGALYNYGLLEARNKLTAVSGSYSGYAGSYAASTEVDIRTTGNVSNSGEFLGASRVTVTAGGSFTNGTGSKVDAVSFGLTSKGFKNQGTIDVYGLFADVDGQADNYGTIKTETYFGLEADRFLNRAGARALSDGHLYIKTGAAGLTNYANAQIRGEVADLRVGTLSNSGLIEGREVVNVADVTGDIYNVAGATIRGKTIALITDRNFRNDGVIGHKTNTDLLNVYGKGAADNRGQAAAKELRVVSNGAVKNTGSLEANDFLGLKSNASHVSNYGVLRGNATLIEAKGNFLNEKLVQANQEIFLDVDGTITNRDGTNTKGEIKAPTVGLVAGNDVNNNGLLFGYSALGVTAENGRIYNGGRITGPDITLVARKSGVYSPADIIAGGTLAIEARVIGLRGLTRVTDAVQLKTTHYDIEVDGRIDTKELYIDAARTLKAKAGVLRGSNRTQIIAGDIQRTDTSSKNAKLGSIANAKGDIYVRLKSGSLGTFGNLDGSGHVYENVNWNVARSVSIIADAGNIMLSGRIQADEDVFVHAKSNNVGIKNIRFDVGDVLHLEGRKYLKKNGWWNPASANKVQLIQNTGWFYTDDWLADTNVNYHLTAQAKTIVVNSSHRFVNKNLFLRASDKITQRDQVISARQLTYSAGNDILIKFDPFAWRAANASVSNGSSWWDMPNAGRRGHTVLSQAAGATLYAGRDVLLKSGKIHSGGDLTIAAGRNVISEPLYINNTRGWENGKNNVPGNVGWNFSTKYRDAGNWRPSSSALADRRVEGSLASAEQVRDGTRYKIKERRAYVNYITATNTVDIYAGDYATFVGTQIESSNKDIYIQAGKGINFAAASGSREYAHSWSRKDRNIFRTKYETWAIYQYDDIYTSPLVKAGRGAVSLVSEGDILSAGTKIVAKNDLLIASRQRNVTLGTYKERYYRIYKYTKKRSTLGGLINLGGSSSTTSVDVNINTGNDFRSDGQLTVKAENDIRIIGGRYQARKVILDAGRNLYIDGAIDDIRVEKFSQRSNFVTITTIQEGFDTETVSLPEIRSTEEPDFVVGGEVHIGGWRGADLNSSLLQTIQRRDFDNALVNLYTPSDRNGAASSAQEIDRKYTRSYDLPGASNGAQFAYLDTLIQDYDASYATIELRDHEWYDKQVQLTPAFQALLQVAVSYATGGTGFGLFGTAGSQTVVQIAAGQAFNSFTVSVIGGAITGEFDLGDALESALIVGGTSFVSSHINSALGFDNIPSSIGEAGGLQEYFAPDVLLDRLGSRIVNNGVSNVFNGNDFFDGIEDVGRSFLVSETLAVAQFGIGELGAGNANWEGSIGHLLLHGGVGCVALEAVNGDCAAGFFSGASSSLLAGSNLTDAQKIELAPLIGALAAFPFANGSATNVSFGSSVAASAIVNNYLTHADVTAAEEFLANCTDSQESCEEQVVQFLLTRSQANDLALLQSCEYNIECIRDFTFDTSNDLITGYELIAFDSSLSVELRAEIVARGAADYGSDITSILGFDEEDLQFIEEAGPAGQVIAVGERLSIYTAEEIVLLSLSSLGAGSLASLSPAVAARLVAICRSSTACVNRFLAAEAATGVVDLVACADGDVLSCATAVGPGTTVGGTLTDASRFADTFVREEDYAAYVLRKEARGETPRSVEDYIAARERFAQIQGQHNAAVTDIDAFMNGQGFNGSSQPLREVTLVGPDGTVARTDLVIVDPSRAGETIPVPTGYRAETINGTPIDGPLQLDANGSLTIEVKTGNAGLTCNQSCVYEYQVMNGNVTAVGNNAIPIGGTDPITAPSNVVVLRPE